MKKRERLPPESLHNTEKTVVFHNEPMMHSGTDQSWKYVSEQSLLRSIYLASRRLTSTREFLMKIIWRRERAWLRTKLDFTALPLVKPLFDLRTQWSPDFCLRLLPSLVSSTTRQKSRISCVWRVQDENFSGMLGHGPPPNLHKFETDCFDQSSWN